MTRIYRTDIDGLRALAVISVILFHLGYITNGYLGVDVFFVISGFLITGIVYREVEENRFTLLKFYERRIRRIIPLVIFVSSVAFVLGLIFMLPDDLENLCQSVVASNFSANNILMKLTSADYWAVKNEYKPLMHTWSLGIEEQFYILYPIIFSLLAGARRKFIFPTLVILSLASLSAFLISNNASAKFYYLQFRFFELAVGGLCAVFFRKNSRIPHPELSKYFLFAFLIALSCILLTNVIQSKDVKVLLVTALSAGILVLGSQHFQNNKVYKFVLSNRLFSGIGKISFSLYMWHQIIFSFSRYFLVERITPPYAIGLSTLLVCVSVLTYLFIENPCRNRKLIKIKPLLLILTLSLFALISSSFYVYMVGGNIKDVPELGIRRDNRPTQLNFFSSQSNINIQYNENIRKLDKPFPTDANKASQDLKKTNILILGDSFGRDVANILLESLHHKHIELSYSDLISISDEDLAQRIHEAKLIFFASDYPDKHFVEKYRLDMNKVWIFGTKDFGISNGIHYNRTIKDYADYRAPMKQNVLQENEKLKSIWTPKYIDLIEPIRDNAGDVLVFTPDGKFISQDTLHLTKFGAAFYAKLLNAKMKEILETVQ
ncbi:MAG: acyltransferase [Bradymonadales bacterium]|jgi:peptidoglycan/LPS O-acetylase OafA/YrhL